MKVRTHIVFLNKGNDLIIISKTGDDIAKKEKRILGNKDGLLGDEAMKIAHDIFPVVENFITKNIGDMHGKDFHNDKTTVSKRTIVKDKNALFVYIDILVTIIAEIDVPTIKRLITTKLPIGEEDRTRVSFNPSFCTEDRRDIIDFMFETGSLTSADFLLE